MITNTNLRSIRRSVSKPVMQSLVVALVLTRLDYGNATLAGLANQSLVKLQSVLNHQCCRSFDFLVT